MNKLLLSITLFVATVSISKAQTKVSGVAKNAATNAEIYNLTVRLDGISNETVLTDRIGYFQFVDVPEGTYKLQILGVGFDPYVQIVSINGQQELELGDIFLTYNPIAICVVLIILIVVFWIVAIKAYQHYTSIDYLRQYWARKYNVI